MISLIVTVLISLILLVAAGAVLRWAMQRFDAPEPIQVVVYAALAIVCLLLLAMLIPGVGLHWSGWNR